MSIQTWIVKRQTTWADAKPNRIEYVARRGDWREKATQKQLQALDEVWVLIEDRLKACQGPSTDWIAEKTGSSHVIVNAYMRSKGAKYMGGAWRSIGYTKWHQPVSRSKATPT